MAFASVPRLWAGSTVICIGTGPSLTQADVDFCRGKARVIAVNDAFEICPWADVLYAADAKWWNWKKGAPQFAGLKYTLETEATKWPCVQCLRRTGFVGLETDPTGLRSGHNSTYQACNLAFHFGASRIILLGVDMKGGHFFRRGHPDGSRPQFGMCLRDFPSIVAPLQAAGVSIVNATRSTALTGIPRASLEEALADVAHAAR